MVDKIREARLRWFVHVKRRSIDTLVTRRERLAIKGTVRGRGSPMKYWGQLVRQNVMQLHVIEDMTCRL